MDNSMGSLKLFKMSGVYISIVTVLMHYFVFLFMYMHVCVCIEFVDQTML